MKTYIRRQQHKKYFKHQDIKQKEPPQNCRESIVDNRNSNICVSERFLKLLFTSSAFMNKTDLKSE